MGVLELIQGMAKPKWAVNAEVLMKHNSIQQGDLLDIFGVTTKGAIGHYFNGRREPSLNGLIKLSELLHISMSDLFGEDIPVGETKQRDNVQDISEQHLTDALKLLARAIEISTDDVEVFFKVYEKVGPDNILKAARILSKADYQSTDKISAVIEIQDFIKQATG
ncbi:helix-turn-helix domain-containing protein [Shewanella sp. D64]|uniref:helix-turn-helix domain-containing protein n=1 Tax=unclassified Shewanella TaxID=196818 RepID=UPI0022BA2F23|nr:MULTISPECIES: helix-turn-helix transcriptional regulator [unclassified Shewanella]MEC4724285.1 helix-turn-helix domain-containing protein [Shewanella sp. D64]MEC4738797.1 helix-turn-helix domain-containing protein [Shewanella sp. E94]WBJ97764.1 helix-turn-helix domain-containing protein [Shewanella sp. MTB7]